MQAVVNGFIMFEKWRALTIAKVDERIAYMLSQKKNIGIQLRLKARLEQFDKCCYAAVGGGNCRPSHVSMQNGQRGCGRGEK